MDINDLRSLVLVALFVCFIVIGLWAYSRRQKQPFKEASELPFADEVHHQQTVIASEADTLDKGKKESTPDS